MTELRETLEELVRKKQDELVKAFEKCAKLKTPEGRADCRDRLPRHIASNIPDRDDKVSALEQLVKVCSDYEDKDDGINKLVEAVEFYEIGKDYMVSVRDCANKLREAIKAAHKSDIGRTTPIGGDVTMSKEQRYALVIGIKEYQQVWPEDQQPSPRPFTNLTFADEDAREFAAFLRCKEQGYIVDLLVNAEAGLRQIMEAFETLRKRCQDASNSLALFFFSGHGWRDEGGRHYLVPYDGRKDEPFSTLLWSKVFDLSLKELKTDRLMVFLDACHAGGIGEDDPEMKGQAEYNPQSLIKDLTARYVVASCKAGQQSREHAGHGIFTDQLLKLWRLDEKSNDFDELEAVDLWDLWIKLKDKVKQTVKDVYKGAVQEPWANFAEKVDETKTGIIIAINEKAKKNRKDKEKGFLAELCEFSPLRGSLITEDIDSALKRFIEHSEQRGAESDFFIYFRNSVRLYSHTFPGREKKLDIVAQTLFDKFAPPPVPATGSGAQLAKSSVTPEQPSLASDQFARRVVAPGSEPVAAALPSLSSVLLVSEEEAQHVKKQFADAACDYVLEKLMSRTYWKAYLSLNPLLRDVGGVSKQAFYKVWGDLKDVDDALLEELTKRFDEKWDKAPVITAGNAASVRILR